jgi:hypothetical protein
MNKSQKITQTSYNPETELYKINFAKENCQNSIMILNYKYNTGNNNKKKHRFKIESMSFTFRASFMPSITLSKMAVRSDSKACQ